MCNWCYWGIESCGNFAIITVNDVGYWFFMFDMTEEDVIELDGWIWLVTKMLQYQKIDISEGIDINKTSASKECVLCHYWYFKDVWFKFELHACNKCHNVLMTAYELKNIAILNVKGVDYRWILWGISKTEAVNILNNSLLEDKGVL